MTDSYNKFKSTTIYGNLINDTSGTYLANALFKGNVGFNGNINLGSSSNIYFNSSLTPYTMTTHSYYQSQVQPVSNSYSGYFLKIQNDAGLGGTQYILGLFDANTITGYIPYIKIWNQLGGNATETNMKIQSNTSLFTGGLNYVILPFNNIITLKASGNTWIVVESFLNTDANPLQNLLNAIL